MASRSDWLDAGLEILGAHGAPAVTIERLTERLDLSKGSFYHHFRGMSGYRTALLAHFEEMWTTRLIETAERGPAAPAAVRLRRLLDLVVSEDDSGPELEVAVRAWAQQDPEARALQERVDRARTDYLRKLWLERTGDAARADWVADLIYTITIGCAHRIPPVPKADMRNLYVRALQLAGGDNVFEEE